MKLTIIAVLAFAVASIALGSNDHKVLAGVAAYLSVVLLVLAVHHRIHSHNEMFEDKTNLRKLPEAHGCYEMENEE